MGPDIRMFSENHNFSANDVIIKNQGESRKGVEIGNNCWIGANSTILDGVKGGDNTVIAAECCDKIISKRSGNRWVTNKNN